ncbi:MAG: zinc ribbon domain-containing protein [bacterium]
MPFYDYKCPKCQDKFEVKKGMNDMLEVVCPKCHTVATRLFSVPRTLKEGNAGSCSDCSSGVCSTCPSK